MAEQCYHGDRYAFGSDNAHKNFERTKRALLNMGDQIVPGLLKILDGNIGESLFVPSTGKVIIPLTDRISAELLGELGAYHGLFDRFFSRQITAGTRARWGYLISLSSSFIKSSTIGL